MPQTIIDIDGSKPLTESVKPLNSPLIVLAGDFPTKCTDQIASIFQRAVVPAAIEVGAVVVDDARRSGCASALAAAALDQNQPARLVGIVPSDRSGDEIDPNHDQILRLPAAWNHTPKSMFQVTAQLINDPAVSNRIVVLLFGGTDDDEKFLVQCARACWPVIVVGGTGGLADQIVAASKLQPDGTPPLTPSDPNLREIVETGNLSLTSADESMDDFQRQILAQIDRTTASETLKQAWARFNEMDRTALREQKLFRRVELALIILAVLAALVAILSQLFGTQSSPLHLAVIIVPILISIMGAYNSHFRDGNKWILLRGSAEALKRETYRFRAKAGVYSDEQCQQTSRELKFAAKLKDILSALEQSEVNKTSLEAKPEPPSQQIDFLSPEEYIHERIEDQIVYFVKKTRKLSRKLITMQLCIYVVGGIGTLLAAIRLDVWVALATAVVTAFTTKLQADQTENSLMQYNQTLASLRNIVSWWKALSRWEKSRRKNIDVLIDQTEKALETETAGWVQQMQSALDKLTEKEPATQNQ